MRKERQIGVVRLCARTVEAIRMATTAGLAGVAISQLIVVAALGLTSCLAHDEDPPVAGHAHGTDTISASGASTWSPRHGAAAVAGGPHSSDDGHPSPTSVSARWPSVVVGGASEDGNDWQTLRQCPRQKVIFGPQGGFHIWVSARVRAPSSPQALIRVRMTQSGSEPLAQAGELAWSVLLSAAEAPVSDASSPWLEVIGLPYYIKQPCAAHQRQFDVRVRAVDSTGVERVGHGCLVAVLGPQSAVKCPSRVPPGGPP